MVDAAAAVTADAATPQIDEEEEPEGSEVEPEAKGGLAELWEQFGMLAILLIFRVGFMFLRPFLARQGTGTI